MTTPEKFRKRQRLEAAGLAVLGVLFLAFGIADGQGDDAAEERDDAQTECIAENFTELNYALGIRGRLAAQDDLLDRREAKVSDLERNATRRVLSFIADATNHPPAPEDLDATRAAFRKVTTRYDKQLDKVAERREAIVERRALIARRREQHPVPPYPEGECT